MKATEFDLIPNAVKFDEPVSPDHPFFTDFTGLRGAFKQQVVFKELHFDIKRQIFDYKLYSKNKTFVFLAGMPGSGKTTELLKYSKILNHPQGFFVVWCSIDEELDINDLEYMDILIFQLERLIRRVKEEKIKVKDSILEAMNKWFEVRVKEINKKISAEAGIGINVGTEGNLLDRLLGFAVNLKASITGVKESASVIRRIFRNNFVEFAYKFNEFLENVNEKIREENKGNEVLFIIDGLEKTLTTDIRRKIIMEETNRIKKIKAYTIFTLPVELLKEREKLLHHFRILSFPFIKIEDEQGNKIAKAYDKLREFILKRVDKKLFENEQMIDTIIHYSGGSPREALRIIHYTWLMSDDDATILTVEALNRGLQTLADETAAFLTEKHLEKIKQINEANKKGLAVPYDETLEEMLEKLLVMEYNDGKIKRVNPILTLSKIYKDYVK